MNFQKRKQKRKLKETFEGFDGVECNVPPNVPVPLFGSDKPVEETVQQRYPILIPVVRLNRLDLPSCRSAPKRMRQDSESDATSTRSAADIVDDQIHGCQSCMSPRQLPDSTCDTPNDVASPALKEPGAETLPNDDDAVPVSTESNEAASQPSVTKAARHPASSSSSVASGSRSLFETLCEMRCEPETTCETLQETLFDGQSETTENSCADEQNTFGAGTVSDCDTVQTVPVADECVALRTNEIVCAEQGSDGINGINAVSSLPSDTENVAPFPSSSGADNVDSLCTANMSDGVTIEVDLSVSETVRNANTSTTTDKETMSATPDGLEIYAALGRTGSETCCDGDSRRSNEESSQCVIMTSTGMSDRANMDAETVCDVAARCETVLVTNETSAEPTTKLSEILEHAPNDVIQAASSDATGMTLTGIGASSSCPDGSTLGEVPTSDGIVTANPDFGIHRAPSIPQSDSQRISDSSSEQGYGTESVQTLEDGFSVVTMSSSKESSSSQEFSGYKKHHSALQPSHVETLFDSNGRALAICMKLYSELTLSVTAANYDQFTERVTVLEQLYEAWKNNKLVLLTCVGSESDDVEPEEAGSAMCSLLPAQRSNVLPDGVAISSACNSTDSAYSTPNHESSGAGFSRDKAATKCTTCHGIVTSASALTDRCQVDQQTYCSDRCSESSTASSLPGLEATSFGSLDGNGNKIHTVGLQTSPISSPPDSPRPQRMIEYNPNGSYRSFNYEMQNGTSDIDADSITKAFESSLNISTVFGAARRPPKAVTRPRNPRKPRQMTGDGAKGPRSKKLVPPGAVMWCGSPTVSPDSLNPFAAVTSDSQSSTGRGSGTVGRKPRRPKKGSDAAPPTPQQSSSSGSVYDLDQLSDLSSQVFDSDFQFLVVSEASGPWLPADQSTYSISEQQLQEAYSALEQYSNWTEAQLNELSKSSAAGGQLAKAAASAENLPLGPIPQTGSFGVDAQQTLGIELATAGSSALLGDDNNCLGSLPDDVSCLTRSELFGGSGLQDLSIHTGSAAAVLAAAGLSSLCADACVVEPAESSGLPTVPVPSPFPSHIASSLPNEVVVKRKCGRPRKKKNVEPEFMDETSQCLNNFPAGSEQSDTGTKKKSNTKSAKRASSKTKSSKKYKNNIADGDGLHASPRVRKKCGRKPKVKLDASGIPMIDKEKPTQVRSRPPKNPKTCPAVSHDDLAAIVQDFEDLIQYDAPSVEVPQLLIESSVIPTLAALPLPSIESFFRTNSDLPGSETCETQPDQPAPPPTTCDFEPVASADEPVASADETVASADEPVSSADEPVASADETVASADEPVSSADEPVASADETVASTEEPVASADETVASADETVASADEPVASADKTVASADETVTAAAETEQLIEQDELPILAADIGSPPALVVNPQPLLPSFDVSEDTEEFDEFDHREMEDDVPVLTISCPPQQLPQKVTKADLKTSVVKPKSLDADVSAVAPTDRTFLHSYLDSIRCTDRTRHMRQRRKKLKADGSPTTSEIAKLSIDSILSRIAGRKSDQPESSNAEVDCDQTLSVEQPEQLEQSSAELTANSESTSPEAETPNEVTVTEEVNGYAPRMPPVAVDSDTFESEIDDNAYQSSAIDSSADMFLESPVTSGDLPEFDIHARSSATITESDNSPISSVGNPDDSSRPDAEIPPENLPVICSSTGDQQGTVAKSLACLAPATKPLVFKLKLAGSSSYVMPSPLCKKPPIEKFTIRKVQPIALQGHIVQKPRMRKLLCLKPPPGSSEDRSTQKQRNAAGVNFDDDLKLHCWKPVVELVRLDLSRVMKQKPRITKPFRSIIFDRYSDVEPSDDDDDITYRKSSKCRRQKRQQKTGTTLMSAYVGKSPCKQPPYEVIVLDSDSEDNDTVIRDILAAIVDVVQETALPSRQTDNSVPPPAAVDLNSAVPETVPTTILSQCKDGRKRGRKSKDKEAKLPIKTSKTSNKEAKLPIKTSKTSSFTGGLSLQRAANFARKDRAELVERRKSLKVTEIGDNEPTASSERSSASQNLCAEKLTVPMNVVDVPVNSFQAANEQSIETNTANAASVALEFSQNDSSPSPATDQRPLEKMQATADNLLQSLPVTPDDIESAPCGTALDSSANEVMRREVRMVSVLWEQLAAEWNPAGRSVSRTTASPVEQTTTLPELPALPAAGNAEPELPMEMLNRYVDCEPSLSPSSLRIDEEVHTEDSVDGLPTDVDAFLLRVIEPENQPSSVGSGTETTGLDCCLPPEHFPPPDTPLVENEPDGLPPNIDASLVRVIQPDSRLSTPVHSSDSSPEIGGVALSVIYGPPCDMGAAICCEQSMDLGNSALTSDTHLSGGMAFRSLIPDERQYEAISDVEVDDTTVADNEDSHTDTSADDYVVVLDSEDELMVDIDDDLGIAADGSGELTICAAEEQATGQEVGVERLEQDEVTTAPPSQSKELESLVALAAASATNVENVQAIEMQSNGNISGTAGASTEIAVSGTSLASETAAAESCTATTGLQPAQTQTWSSESTSQSFSSSCQTTVSENAENTSANNAALVQAYNASIGSEIWAHNEAILQAFEAQMESDIVDQNCGTETWSLAGTLPTAAGSLDTMSCYPADAAAASEHGIWNQQMTADTATGDAALMQIDSNGLVQASACEAYEIPAGVTVAWNGVASNVPDSVGWPVVTGDCLPSWSGCANTSPGNLLDPAGLLPVAMWNTGAMPASSAAASPFEPLSYANDTWNSDNIALTCTGTDNSWSLTHVASSLSVQADVGVSSDLVLESVPPPAVNTSAINGLWSL